ncbi:MAG: hypothetical protein HOW73_27150 [Polyangiaceae bacterium]|nr:hypothetical protein [Polyangiaceae bacterium]
MLPVRYWALSAAVSTALSLAGCAAPITPGTTISSPAGRAPDDELERMLREVTAKCAKNDGDPRRWSTTSWPLAEWDYAAGGYPCSWTVELEADGVRAAATKPFSFPKTPRLPFRPHTVPKWEVVRCSGGADDYVPPDQDVRTFAEVAGGFLVGYNSGEFGGGLYWYEKTGALRQQVLDENVDGIIPLAGGLVVLTGLAHLGGDHGRASVLMADGPVWRVKKSLDITGQARASFVDADGSIFIATSKRVVRIRDLRKVEVLHTFDPRFEHVSSLVKTAEGTLYLGGLVAVVRLTPTDDGYVEARLAPGATPP